MPIIFLTVRSVRFVRFVKFAPFQALPLATRQGILINIAKQTAVGFAVRATGEIIVGIIVDPFNRIIVPASRGRLDTSRQAALDLAAIDVSGPTIVAIAFDPLGVFFHGLKPKLRAGQMAIFRVAGKIETAVEENLNLGFLVGGAVGGVLSPTGKQ